MLEQARARTAEFQQRLKDENIEVAVLTDESSIAYFAGFWGYLSVEFGRPTFLIVRPDEEPVVITPMMESEMVSAMTWVTRIMTWEDSGPHRWEKVLDRALGKTAGKVAAEIGLMPALVRNWFERERPGIELLDVSPIVGKMRMIKSPEEIRVMKQVGAIAGAMMQAAEGALAEGSPEYEAALAVIIAGTRRAF